MAAIALVCAWGSLPGLAFQPVAAGILLALAWHLAHALQWTGSAVHALELNASGGARCQDGLGRWCEAQVLPGSYVSEWLIVVMLAAGKRRLSLVLLPDAAAAEELRRLRMWLRWRFARP